MTVRCESSMGLATLQRTHAFWKASSICVAVYSPLRYPNAAIQMRFVTVGGHKTLEDSGQPAKAVRTLPAHGNSFGDSLRRSVGKDVAVQTVRPALLVVRCEVNAAAALHAGDQDGRRVSALAGQRDECLVRERGSAAAE